jgi:hypothetical protein
MGRLIYLLWLYPLFEGGCLILGWAKWQHKHPHQGDSGATEAIIQITTVGNYDTVNEIIAAVRGYDLPFPYQFWIVTEPGVPHHYVGADDLIVVPAEFTALSSYKARAQEYSRRVRQMRGLDRRDVKIIMLDDDSLPTAKYFIDVYHADYDICEGILCPRRGYGRFLSHIDDLRTLNCLTICSFAQGIGHPIWVHGEGLCFRGSAEAEITWNYPVVASEDLTVGQNAVERGMTCMTWGFVWEYIQLTSPWTFKDFVKQRRRWIWGNIWALRNGLIPPFGAFMVTLRWLLGFINEILVTAALILVPLGIWNPPDQLLYVLYASLGVWFLTFGLACWIGANEEGASMPKRIGNTAVGIILAPITAFITISVLLINVLRGDPRGFEVIAKSAPKAKVD